MSGMKAVLRNAAVLTEKEIAGVIAEKVTVADLARKYGRANGTIVDWLRVRGVEDVPVHVRARERTKKAIKERMPVVKMAKEIGFRKTGDHFGISWQRVQQIVRRAEGRE